MARRNGIAGQLPFGAPVTRDAACGIGGGSRVPLNAAPGIGGCRSVGVGARKTGVSDLALSTRRHARGALGRVSAGRGGIGKSYASRLLGKGVTVDVTRTGEGSYSATITTEGKSMANKVLGNRLQMNGGRHANGYHGSVGVGAPQQPCYPSQQPCGDGRETCTYKMPGKFQSALGCRGSATWTYDQGGTPARPKADLSPAYPRRRRPPKAGMSPVPGGHPKADLSPAYPRRPAPGIKRGRRGRALTLKAGR